MIEARRSTSSAFDRIVVAAAAACRRAGRGGAAAYEIACGRAAYVLVRTEAAWERGLDPCRGAVPHLAGLPVVRDARLRSCAVEVRTVSSASADADADAASP